ncbi:MAG TPA: hypothetical protein VLH40_00615, partial [Atribacteraceae bacterium]|nr:hypothetical protein [Atribacteraceae bacterium]
MNKDSGPMRHSTKILLFCLFTAVLLLGLAESTQAQDIFSYYRGRVQEVREFIPEFTLADLGQEADVLITSGPHRGEIVTIVNHYSEQEFYLGTKIHPGQTVILAVEEIDGEIIGAYLQDIARDREIWLLTALFLLAIL